MDSKNECKFGTNCKNPKCRFSHSTNYLYGDGRCAFGANCTRPGCWYTHPDNTAPAEPPVQIIQPVTHEEPQTFLAELLEPDNNYLFYTNEYFQRAFNKGLAWYDVNSEEAIAFHNYALDELTEFEEVILHHEMMDLLMEAQADNEILEDEIASL